MLHRIEVRSKPGHASPASDAALREARASGVSGGPSRVDHTDVYLIEGDFSGDAVDRIATGLLADPVTQLATVGADDPVGDAYIEVQPLPGVMDPAAQPIEMAIGAMLGVEARVQTGRRYDLFGVDGATARVLAERCFANTVIQAIHDVPFHPDAFPSGEARDVEVVEVPLRDLDDAELERLSREAHLFLSLEEMQAIQTEYQTLGREPREIELETLAQTWSEHCVHKTLKATIRYREETTLPVSPSPVTPDHPGHTLNPDGSITINNLLKSTVVAATHELMADGIDWCLSVFVDNAGIIAFDDDHAVCFKAETHNHPSAIEPYGGAATGIGGCIRDIIGTGLAAKPIASTDVFCVAYPDGWSRDQGTKAPRHEDSDESARCLDPSMPRSLPAGCLHPRRILRRVVDGVRDYGNRMGIPTVNGAVWFDDRYVGNPLVYCGSIGVMPRDRIEGDPNPGDRIIAIGGRTGRDGIHGATFSSAELTDTHADEFSHAVQIGNPVTEKLVLDLILEARDHADGCLFTSITDCGAGGFSSAVGEMGEKLGAYVTLENAPLKYEGLTPTEIWISEAQERMVLAVPKENIAALQSICDKHDGEMCDLGYFGTEGQNLILTYSGDEVGRLPMMFLHDGIPQTTKEAVWVEEKSSPRVSVNIPSVEEALLALLAHPNIASKHWIIRQYDHEVQGNSVIKPLVGPAGQGPGDAAVVLPVQGSTRGLAIGNGLATGFSDDPYVMTLMAIDECVRNLVCVGADPERIAILDNFCWPSCNDPHNLASLVRAAEACYDGAKAYRTPFISGKDSLNNQFTTEDGETIKIPPTLLISGMGIVPDVMKCVTMDAKKAGNVLVLVGAETLGHCGGSHYQQMFGGGDARTPRVDMQRGPATARAVHTLISRGLVRSAHDVSDGGLLCAVAEMCIGGDLGFEMEAMWASGEKLFSEEPCRYLLEIEANQVDVVRESLGSDISYTPVGKFTTTTQFVILAGEFDIKVDTLRTTWLGTLDW